MFILHYPLDILYSKFLLVILQPVNMYPANELGFHDLFGNAWEWAEDHFNGLDGYSSHWYYDDFSSPCFDGRHNLILVRLGLLLDKTLLILSQMDVFGLVSLQIIYRCLFSNFREDPGCPLVMRPPSLLALPSGDISFSMLVSALLDLYRWPTKSMSLPDLSRTRCLFLASA